MDPKQTLKDSRIIILDGSITDDLCTSICLDMLYLEAIDPTKDITLLLNSQGGSIQAGYMLIDTMRILKPDVQVICMGLAASMGAMILMAGTKGKRKALPHAKVMLHQPLGGANLMQAADFEITAREMSKTKTDIYKFISSCTGKTFEQVSSDCDRNFWMTTKEAMDYGIIDSIVTKESR